MDWYTAAQRAAEPHRTAILAAAADLCCAYLEAQATLATLRPMLDEGDTQR